MFKKLIPHHGGPDANPLITEAIKALSLSLKSPLLQLFLIIKEKLLEKLKFHGIQKPILVVPVKVIFALPLNK